ncbi:unnamed protein product [Closterium sp. NIES-53]
MLCPCFPTCCAHASPHAVPMLPHMLCPCFPTRCAHASPHAVPMLPHTLCPCFPTRCAHASPHAVPQAAHGSTRREELAVPLAHHSNLPQAHSKHAPASFCLCACPCAWQVLLRHWSRVLGAQPGQREHAGSEEPCAAGGEGAGQGSGGGRAEEAGGREGGGREGSEGGEGVAAFCSGAGEAVLWHMDDEEPRVRWGGRERVMG